MKCLRICCELQIGCVLLANVFQLSSDEKKRKVVTDMEAHLNELRRDVEQLKQNMDPAADTKYNNTVHISFSSPLVEVIK